MAKRPKHGRHASCQWKALRPRIERAMHENRYQQALELCKQLHKHEPTPEHRQLLCRVSLGRVEQLRRQNYTRDALAILENVVQLAQGDAGLL